MDGTVFLNLKQASPRICFGLPDTPTSKIDQQVLSLSMDYKNHIEINPNVRFGKPCVKGTRISVYDVLGWMAAGMTKPEILEDFPKLTEADILACLSYSADKERKIKVAV